jgi:hypothetical protein
MVPRIVAIWVVLCLLLVPALLFAPAAPAASRVHFFVAPNGSSSGDGSFTRPWNIATAFAHPKTVWPGDTIWLRGGIYRATSHTRDTGAFNSYLSGTKDNPIIVRQYPGERAVLDGVGVGTDPTFVVRGRWTTYWGFEVVNSNRRPSLGNGIVARAPGAKFINMIVHDTGMGLSLKTDTSDTELYGSLVFFNGYLERYRYTHGVYAGNQTGTKRIVDNIVFQNFSHGIHAYAEYGGYLNNLHVEGNIAFSNGEPAGAFARNILVGGWRVVALSPVVRNNYTYYPLAARAGENNLGYASGCTNLTLRANYFVGGANALVINRCTPIAATGNVFRGITRGVPSSAGVAMTRTGVEVLVRPNMYEPGRAHIAVYNWDQNDVVEVDLSGVLPTGTTYEVRNAQDYFGPPVVTGQYDGSPVRIPMVGLRVAKPFESLPRQLTTTGPRFGAFVLIGQMPQPTVVTSSPPRLVPTAR